MLNTRELTGSKEQIVEQISRIEGRIISAIVFTEEPLATAKHPISDEEFARLMKEMEADTVSMPHADDSREAIYTRMPGE